jgi:hypothetical protein
VLDFVSIGGDTLITVPIPFPTQCVLYVALFLSQLYLPYTWHAYWLLYNILYPRWEGTFGVRVKGGSKCFTGPPWKTLKLAIFILKKFWLQIWFQKYYISPIDAQFLINKHKNRGRLLFIVALVKSSLPRFRALRLYCFSLFLFLPLGCFGRVFGCILLLQWKLSFICAKINK